jgi:hypothetical protein
MKKILWFLFGVLLVVGLGMMVRNAWQTAAYFEANGRVGTLKVGKKYNASRWTTPLPLKKIYTYTAVLAPDHEVLIESDQSLEEDKEYSVRFLLRDRATEGRRLSLRPLAGAIRLKSEADGTPVKLADSDLFDRAVAKAMGPMGEGYHEQARPVAEAAPSHEKPTVPYLFAGAEDPVPQVIWNNTTLGEWLIAIIWGFTAQLAFLQAWPRAARRQLPGKAGSHDPMRRIEADKPLPQATIGYTPKPENADFVPPPAKPRVTIPAPASTTQVPATPRPPVSPVAPANSTTAPFVPPADATEPALKLKRKPKE